MIVMGIDPGNVRTGYGVIERVGAVFSHIESGLLRIPKTADHGKQLLALERGLEKLIKKTRPNIVGIERVFLAKNKKTGVFVIQARGIITKVVAANNIRTVELPPSSIKLAVTGSGRADKGGVAKMVGFFLGIGTAGILDDVTDALAIAIAASGRHRNDTVAPS